MNNKISGIYQIRSIIKPERCYIGSAVSINNRWGTHLWNLRKHHHVNKILQHHYNKYGESDLVFSILLGCEKDYLIANEQFFIDSYKPYFNIRIKANSNLGLKASDETKAKMSVAQRTKTPNTSEESRFNRSVWQKGIKKGDMPDSVKHKIGLANKGKKKPPFTMEHKLKISQAHMNKKRPPFTKETIERMKKAWVVRKNKKVA